MSLTTVKSGKGKTKWAGPKKATKKVTKKAPAKKAAKRTFGKKVM